MARPTKLTEELIGALVFAIAGGASAESAATALGIGRRTFYDWMSRGRKPGPGDHLFVELAERVEQARGLADVAREQGLLKLAQRDSRAAIYLDQKLELRKARLDNAAAARGETGPLIRIVIERKVPTHGGTDEGARAMESDAERDDGLEDSEGAGDPVDGGGGVVERGLGEPGRNSGGGVVVDVHGRSVA